VSADVREFYKGKPRTPHKSHDVVLDESSTVPPNGQLDGSEQLTNGQSDDVRIVVVLWSDGQCVRCQIVVEIDRPRQGIGVVIEERNDLRGSRKHRHIGSVQRTHRIISAIVASEVVATAPTVDIGDVRELNERASGTSDDINDRGSLYHANSPKVMSECENRPPVPDFAEFLVHRVVQDAGRFELRPDENIRADLVCHPADLECFEKDPDRIWRKWVTCFVEYMT